MKISFLGDISLNDDYIKFYKEGLSPFQSVEQLLLQSDFVVGNLECMAKGGFGENTLKRPRLTTTVETLNYLNNINLKVACLAQNHVYDHLEDGILKTTEFLTDHKIKYMGAALNETDYDKPLILEKDGIRIGLLNYVTKDTFPNLPSNAKVYLNSFNEDKVISDIQMLKPQVNHVVLLLHWGGRVEGGLYPDWDQPKLARKLIDAGADLIVGHHSHTVQPYEVYKGKYIFYSLGNFCFSDYTFEGKFVPMPKRRMITMVLSVNFKDKNIKPQLSFFKNLGYNYIPLPRYLYNLKFRNFIFNQLLRYKLFWAMYYFMKKKFLSTYLFLLRKDIGFFTKVRRIKKSLKK